MNSRTPPCSTILIAEDDVDDRMLVLDALRECGVIEKVVFVDDGEQLTDYLHHIGKYADPKSSPRPGIIFLDLNMP